MIKYALETLLVASVGRGSHILAGIESVAVLLALI